MLPVNPTSHDFLITAFPEHLLHTILCCYYSSPTAFVELECSCGEIMAVTLGMLSTLSITKADAKHALRNVPPPNLPPLPTKETVQ